MIFFFDGTADELAVLLQPIKQELQDMSQKVDDLKARLASIGDKTSAEHTEVMDAIAALQQQISDLKDGATAAEMDELQQAADRLEESITHIYDAPTTDTGSGEGNGGTSGSGDGGFDTGFGGPGAEPV